MDASIEWGNGKVYLFGEDGYVRYDVASQAADDGWPEAPTGVLIVLEEIDFWFAPVQRPCRCLVPPHRRAMGGDDDIAADQRGPELAELSSATAAKW